MPEPATRRSQPAESRSIRVLIAEGHSPQQIASQTGTDLSVVHQAIADEVPDLRTIKRDRMAQLSAIMRTADEPKQRMSALRLLCKIDGSMAPSEPTLYDEVWAMIARIDDWELPTDVQPPRIAANEGERIRWRATLQRLKRLLTRADDHIAAFERIQQPAGSTCGPDTSLVDKIGRMSRIQLYAQEVGALALRVASTNPTASPAQRADSIGKLVQTLGGNHNNAEASEWGDEVLNSMIGKKE